MSSPILTAAFDALIAVLLIAVIVQAVRLSRMLKTLRDGKAELAATITRFDAAAAHAERAVAAMGAAAADAGQGLGAAIGEATALRDELMFLAERGDGIAARLAGAAAPKSEPKTPRARPELVGDAPKPAAKLSTASETERELLQAMQKARAAG
jgi:Domain of unknown function (DUF6468)